MLVAEAPDGWPAGFVTVDPARRHVDQLAVDPARQGGGIGGLLIRTAQSLSPAGLDLEVNRDNARALGFYTRHGFVVVGEGRNPNSGRPILLLQWRNGPEFRAMAPETATSGPGRTGPHAGPRFAVSP